MSLKGLAGIWTLCWFGWAQQLTSSWQEHVRKCAEKQEWSAAMTIVHREIDRAPRDMDIEARSHFSATETEWRPSGITRVTFPIVSNEKQRLGGNLSFVTGTQDFPQVDQIGRFSCWTYGGGLRFQLTARQDVRGVAAYQK